MRTASRIWCWLCLAAMLCAVGCAPASPAADTVLQVSAAASLSAAFQELGAQFEDKYGTPVEFNFAGSQVLANQIQEGAPVDVFASANMDQMERIIAMELIQAEDARIFAMNRLVIIAEAGSDKKVRELADLAKNGIKLSLAAREVPAGNYALLFLDNAAGDPAFGAGYRQAVLDNVVSYEENVKVVLSRVILGEVDAGILYISDVVGIAKDEIAVIEIPSSLNVTAEYPIAVLKDSPRAQAAQAFVDFTLSEEGQAALAKHGFIRAR